MARLRVTVLALVAGVLAAVVSAHESGAAAGDAAARPGRPVNLKVLRKDIAPARLERLMKRYERELGVTCSYCHVENRDTGELDYVSDENPKKETARIMIAMLDEINERHLAQLGGDQRYAADVSCGSCHQGRANPPVWEARRR
jgi:mono/diheme cytochrome c family protein